MSCDPDGPTSTGLDAYSTAGLPLLVEFQIAMYDVVLFDPRIEYFQLDAPIAAVTVDSYWYLLPEIITLIFILFVILLGSAAYRFCTPSNFKFFVNKQIDLTTNLMYLVFLTYI